MFNRLRKRVFTCGVLAIAALGLQASGIADTFELRNGTIVTGEYAGGTASTIRVETAKGVQVFETKDVLAVTFEANPAESKSNVQSAVTPTSVAVPAGTVLTVRIDSEVSSNNAPGTKFSGKLVSDLMAGTVVVAKAGTAVYGQVQQAAQSGRLAGKSKLAMTLTSIDIGGRLVPILTTDFAEAGVSSGKKTARNMIVGGVVGNAVEDDDGGGKKGAAIGLGASVIRKGDSVTVPAGAILEFRLTQPFNPSGK